MAINNCRIWPARFDDCTDTPSLVNAGPTASGMCTTNRVSTTELDAGGSVNNVPPWLSAPALKVAAPAMALGIAKHAWWIGELLDAALATQPIEPVTTGPVGVVGR